jgi:hypothetical protein
VRSGVLDRVAARPRGHAGAGGAQVELTGEKRGGLGLCHLDELPLAAAAPVFERGEHGDGGELAGDVIGMVERGAGRVGRVGEIP